MRRRAGRGAPGLLLRLFLFSALIAAARAGDWPQFRGPSGDGAAAETGLPVTWSARENLVWRTPLPGPGASTPAVVGDRIYLSAFDAGTGEVLALGLDRASGRVLWKVPAGRGVDSRDRGRENFGCSPSPAAHGDRAWFLFGNGVLLCVDRDGRTLWKRDLQAEIGAFSITFGYASSPLYFDGSLFVQVLHRGNSRVEGLDPATGRSRGTVARATDAIAESQEAYTTPVPFVSRGRGQVLVLGGDRLTAHDAKDGTMTWQWSGYNPHQRENFRVVPSPVVHQAQVFVNAPQGSPLFAVSVTDANPRVAWTHEAPVTDVPTPAWGGNALILLSDKQRRIASLDPASGRVNWNTRLDLSVLRASPLVADGKVYVIDSDGDAVVLSLADGGVLGRSSTREYPCHAGPVAAGGRLYLRTGEALWCIGQAGSPPSR